MVKEIVLPVYKALQLIDRLNGDFRLKILTSLDIPKTFTSQKSLPHFPEHHGPELAVEVEELHDQCLKLYEDMLTMGVSKNDAISVLPLTTRVYIQFYTEYEELETIYNKIISEYL